MTFLLLLATLIRFPRQVADLPGSRSRDASTSYPCEPPILDVEISISLILPNSKICSTSASLYTTFRGVTLPVSYAFASQVFLFYLSLYSKKQPQVCVCGGKKGTHVIGTNVEQSRKASERGKKSQ
ncbi:hypothetical protein PISMIDRAFT_530501 [Pisolithus microcarpus 441]|uniref:Unplaced genomic scaffold scaffold_60, whole genome shotgun sequence n=1 Tax=Pisolithus microcarpus 441 TaxID=765257 RepID=A0A0C9YBG5_9AGAM|nr:hypothetical protein BKA83DRAFT_530501 [Pisolithus microcarpus]KIK22070.1 hypothetical protein PISMIDRAFT_530501 [Pisolithus microcarpus 441]